MGGSSNSLQNLAEHELAQRATPPMGMPDGRVAKAPPALATAALLRQRGPRSSAARDRVALMGTHPTYILHPTFNYALRHCDRDQPSHSHHRP
eukprot:scaffold85392_cov30-Tisochrysis_lutea.AAC.9